MSSNKVERGRELHGLSGHPLYPIWSAMRERCYSESSEAYQYYGARGIEVCELWQISFLAFYKWAISSGYKKGLTLDRKKNSGNYEPGNCRWVTEAIQARNTRRTVTLTIWGESKCLLDWLKDARCAIGEDMFRTYIKQGVPLEKVISVSVQGLTLTAFGKTMTASQWSRDPRCPVGESTIVYRFVRGMKPEDCITKPARNNPKIRLLTAFGETRSAADWSRNYRCTVLASAILRRLSEGMSVEDAISLPRQDDPNKARKVRKVRMLTAFGETRSVCGWAADSRCPVWYLTILERLDRGMSPEDAITLPSATRSSKGQGKKWLKQRKK